MILSKKNKEGLVLVQKRIWQTDNSAASDAKLYLTSIQWEISRIVREIQNSLMLLFHRKKMGQQCCKTGKRILMTNMIHNFYPLPFHGKILSNNVAKPEKRSCIRPDRQTDNSAAAAAKLYLSSVTWLTRFSIVTEISTLLHNKVKMRQK